MGTDVAVVVGGDRAAPRVWTTTEIQWSMVNDPIIGFAHADALDWTPRGFVMIDSALAWESVDGREWTDPAVVHLNPGSDHVASLASVAGTVVGVGSGADGPAAWTSPRVGDWEPATLEPAAGEGGAMADVVDGAAGLVAVGHTEVDGEERPAIWTSLDGVDWQAVDVSDVFEAREARLDAAFWSDSLAMYVVGGWEAAAGDRRPLLATSADGRTWDRVPPTAYDQERTGLGILSFSEIGGDLVAVAADDTSREPRSTTLHTDDGVDWTSQNLSRLTLVHTFEEVRPGRCIVHGEAANQSPSSFVLLGGCQ